MEGFKTKQVRRPDKRQGCLIQKKGKSRHPPPSFGSRPEWNHNFIYGDWKKTLAMKETREETTCEAGIPQPDFVCTHVRTYTLNKDGEAEPGEDMFLCKKPLVLAPWTGGCKEHKVKVTHTLVKTPTSRKEWTETTPSGYWLATVKNEASCPDNYFVTTPLPRTPQPPPPGATLYRSTVSRPPGPEELSAYAKPVTMRRNGEGKYEVDW